jgi:hypothetical protein
MFANGEVDDPGKTKEEGALQKDDYNRRETL